MSANDAKTYPLVDTGLGFSLYIDPMDSYGLMGNGAGGEVGGAARYEAAEVDVCQQLVFPGHRVLDIGANMGYFSVMFSRRVGTSGSVIAFEPEVDSLQLLTKNLALHQARNVQVMPVALADHSGESALYRCPFNVAMHRLYPSVCCDDIGFKVPVCTGDDLALGHVDFVKIDIEGYELPALRGLANTLRSNPNVVVLSEFSPLSMLEAGYHPHEFIDFMRDLNFRAMALAGNTWHSVDWAQLVQETAVFSPHNFEQFHAQASVTGKEALWSVAEHYLAEIKYSRTYYENLLILGPAAKVNLA